MILCGVASGGLLAGEQVAGKSLSSSITWELANPKWAATINPLLANPLVQGFVLENIVLKTGSNAISHKLGRNLVGYLIILNSAAATFYDNQSTNQRPDLTLILNASAPTTVSIYVF